jgi:DNA-binding winged helix-turn-helix (wHTH) protein
MDDLLQTIKAVSRFRALVLAAVIVGLLFQPLQTYQAIPLFALGLLYLAYLIILQEWAIVRLPWREPSSTFILVAVMIAVDVICITLTIAFTGGVTTVLFALYPLCIMYSAIYLGYPSAIAAATMVTLGYGVLLMVTGIPAGVAGTLPVQMPLLYLLAVLSGYVVERELAKRQQARSLHEMLLMERGARDILKVTHDLNSSLQKEEVLQKVAELACQVTGLARCVFAVVDEEKQGIVGAATNVSLPSMGITDIRTLVLPIQPGGATDTALKEGNPVVVENVHADTRVPAGVADRLGLGSLLLIPIIRDEQFLGVMYLDDASKFHHFREEEVRLAKTFSEQAATAIANARMYSDAQERIQNLVAEMRAIMQKKEGLQRPQRTQALKYDGLEIDIPQRRVMVDGKPVGLSWTEFELLHFLAGSPDSAYTRESIFRKVWKQEYYISTNLVDVCVHRLRQKIERNPSEPKYVRTVHGVGYMFAEKPAPGAVSLAGAVPARG